eukprot:829447-Prymnesium_polylepis.2
MSRRGWRGRRGKRSTTDVRRRAGQASVGAAARLQTGRRGAAARSTERRGKHACCGRFGKLACPCAAHTRLPGQVAPRSSSRPARRIRCLQRTRRSSG